MSTRVLTIVAFVRALRVYQWPKNLVVFAALVFAQQLQSPHQIALSVCAFLILCAASSATYLFNDWMDIERDRAHPDKRNRPLASGELGLVAAAAGIVILGGVSLVAAYGIGPRFCASVAFYIVLMALYTSVLKRIMLVDVLVVALGFVVRAIAGALALQVAFSNWLVVCTLFLALFLSLGKRRREIELMEAGAANHREVLGHYTTQFLDAVMLVVLAATLLTYTIYTCSPEVVGRLGTDKLYFTVPFVIYGLFRYLYLVWHRESGGDPSKTLLEDVPLIVAVVLWGLAIVVIIYAGMRV